MDILIAEYKALGISEQINYDKLYLYSIITRSTAIEGSTVTEIENQLLFDEGISPNKSMGEQLMNLFIISASKLIINWYTYTHGQMVTEEWLVLS